MDEFDKILHGATSGGVLPNAALIAADRNGTIIHKIESGTYAPNPDFTPLHPTSSTTTTLSAPTAGVPPDTKPFTADTVCWMASCTKLMATVAALQCVERGLVTLDEDLGRSHLPEFRDAQVLQTFVDEKPVLRPARRAVTLRNLLTHSSGVSYEFVHPKLLTWRRYVNRTDPERKAESRSREASTAFKVPLLFDPDEGWTYGYGIDWAGVVVERVSGLTLEEFLRKNVWAPLVMDSTTFEPKARPELHERVAGMSVRNEDGKLENRNDAFGAMPPPVRQSGGGGCFGTANDYIRFLISLLRNDGRLLKPETVELMFQPNLKDPQYLAKVHAHPDSYGLAGNMAPGTKVDFGLGGILNMQRLPNGRGFGMQWGGLPNLFWWINREDGICGCYFGQLIPPGDVKAFEMYKLYEKHLYQAFLGREGKMAGKL